MGEGEWAAAKHGGRGQRGWKQLHLGVDGAGVIVAHTLTEATVDDATTGIGLIEALDADIARVTADADLTRPLPDRSPPRRQGYG